MKIRQLYKQGLTISEISRIYKIDRKTARKYANTVQQPSYSKRKALQPMLDPYKDYLNQRLTQYDLTSERLFQEIKKQGYQGCYSWVAGYVSQVKRDYRHQAVLRFETLPGEQAQIDWGYLGEIYDKERRKLVKLYCFFMILGYSRMLYAEVFENMKFENFLKGHNNAFQYFGGYPRELLYDNLKSVVIKRALLSKDSEFNKRFIDFAGYYGFKPILCRPYKPNTKGKVENSVKFVKQSFYLGKDFSTLADVNANLKEWLGEANTRLHYTVKEKPIDRLKRETLINLDNKNLYDLTALYWRKISRDCFFSYLGNHYSVPYQYAGKEICLRINTGNLEVIYRKDIIASHALARDKGHFIRKEEHFKGLLEVRCKHRLRKPKKPKEAAIFNPIKPLTNANHTVIQHELSCYDKVI